MLLQGVLLTAGVQQRLGSKLRQSRERGKQHSDAAASGAMHSHKRPHAGGKVSWMAQGQLRAAALQCVLSWGASAWVGVVRCLASSMCMGEPQLRSVDLQTGWLCDERLESSLACNPLAVTAPMNPG